MTLLEARIAAGMRKRGRVPCGPCSSAGRLGVKATQGQESSLFVRDVPESYSRIYAPSDVVNCNMLVRIQTH